MNTGGLPAIEKQRLENRISILEKEKQDYEKANANAKAEIGMKHAMVRSHTSIYYLSFSRSIKQRKKMKKIFNYEQQELFSFLQINFF